MSGFVRMGLALVAIALVPPLAHADVTAAPPPARAPGNETPTDAAGNVHADNGGAVRFAPTDKVVIRSTPDRTAKNIAILAGVAGLGLVVGGFGLYWHLDSRSASNDISTADAAHSFWGPAQQADEARANRSATRAEVAYSIGGALLIGAVVAVIVTAPREETTILHPKVGAAPARGGGSVAAEWSF